MPQKVCHILGIHFTFTGKICILAHRIAARDQGVPQQVRHIFGIHLTITSKVSLYPQTTADSALGIRDKAVGCTVKHLVTAATGMPMVRCVLFPFLAENMNYFSGITTAVTRIIAAIFIYMVSNIKLRTTGAFLPMLFCIDTWYRIFPDKWSALSISNRRSWISGFYSWNILCKRR